MINKEYIKKWVSERSKTINACLDLADLNGEFDQMVSDIIHDCITELSQYNKADLYQVRLSAIHGAATHLRQVMFAHPYCDHVQVVKNYFDIMERTNGWELPNDK